MVLYGIFNVLAFFYFVNFWLVEKLNNVQKTDEYKIIKSIHGIIPITDIPIAPDNRIRKNYF